jgi:hypothetical protein
MNGQEVVKVRTCDGEIDGKKCNGRCKRTLPLRCFKPTINGEAKSCIECQSGTYRSPTSDKYYFGDEWDF